MAYRAVGGCRVHEQPVGLRWPGNRREPTIEHREFLYQGCEDRDALGVEPLHDSARQVPRDGQRLLNETGHGRNGTGAKHLLHDILEGVAWIRVDELRVVGDTDELRLGVISGVRIAFSTREAVDGWVDGLLHPAKHVVEGPVLQDQHHNALNWPPCCIGTAGVVEERGDDEKEKNAELVLGSLHGMVASLQLEQIFEILPELHGSSKFFSGAELFYAPKTS